MERRCRSRCRHQSANEPEDAFERWRAIRCFAIALFRSELADLAALATRTACSTPSPLQKRPSGSLFLPCPAPMRTRAMATSPSPANAMRALCRTSKDGVYQDRLPIDAEMKPSSRRGHWVADMRQNADGSADAKAEWTDRGRRFSGRSLPLFFARVVRRGKTRPRASSIATSRLAARSRPACFQSPGAAPAVCGEEGTCG